MVERHSVEFTDKDEAQKLEFFEGDVHLDIMIFVLILTIKVFLNFSRRYRKP